MQTNIIWRCGSLPLPIIRLKKIIYLFIFKTQKIKTIWNFVVYKAVLFELRS